MIPPRNPHARATDTSVAVDALMRGLAHPHKPAIETLRRAVLATDPSIAEGVKWNAPSFRTREYFATVHLRAKTGVVLILHRGARTRAETADASCFDDPDRLLHWLGPDRAQVAFADADDLARRSGQLQALLRRWITLV
ncbi:DUF1801 domain-containing protein [uncultured Luteimonas sp.]|uniref:DUF1801 domain-containing protein n=1 Tax=uncultured Luteimonas sp. TaxID=453144 RepID=UPI00260CBEDE|nr:DUF1801 domain-containing protein [uncultured Luteimonas sp.]